MLLVTFHGGPAPGINNVYCYDTTTNALLSDQALRNIDSSQLSELRALVYDNGYLYVAIGDKSISNVFTFQHQSSEKPYHFGYVAIDGAGFAYISNQDTNVVARVTVSANFQTSTLPPDCQSTYLLGQSQKLCSSSKCTYLDGTFAASQNGKLDHVALVATDVATQYGGLSVDFATTDKPPKVQNSVRDVGVANGMLFVCDEPSKLIRMYALPSGNYLGSSTLPNKPTHLTVQNGGLYVSADSGLYWSQLPASSPSPSLSFQNVLTAPVSPYKVGGISFNQSNGSGTVYVCFQEGTGKAVGGSIYAYSFTQAASGTQPALTPGALIASSPKDFKDTPEFVLYLPDSLT
jgi:hypothetical protein